MSLARLPRLQTGLLLLLVAGCEPVTQPGTNHTLAVPTSPRYVISSLGMVAPTDSTNDYNGTYQGGQGIGRGYSTLYRDTYTAPHGWRGEGSGMHYGVDIRVNRAPVKASLGGLVMRADSTDKSGWGGLVVIRATNPYTNSGYVYFVYAHLSEIHVAKNTTVLTGQVIGRSGGNWNDSGKGAAQGPHLHFQIDKSMSTSLPSPYSVSFARIDSEIDSDFEVMNSTYSPMVFVQGGYRWEFQRTDTEPWKREELWRAVNVASSGVSGGAFWMDGNYDPWLERGAVRLYCGENAPCGTSIAADASMYKYIRLNVHLNCAVSPLTLYFTTKDNPTFHPDRRIEVPVGYGPATLTIPAYQHGQWSGIITGLRVDPSVNCDWGTEINYIGYIRLVSSSTG
jgi:murein DD-endopeptidase MepM/ murein hydrolase activator NlpD